MEYINGFEVECPMCDPRLTHILVCEFRIADYGFPSHHPEDGPRCGEIRNLQSAIRNLTVSVSLNDEADYTTIVFL